MRSPRSRKSNTEYSISWEVPNYTQCYSRNQESKNKGDHGVGVGKGSGKTNRRIELIWRWKWGKCGPGLTREGNAEGKGVREHKKHYAMFEKVIEQCFSPFLLLRSFNTVPCILVTQP